MVDVLPPGWGPAADMCHQSELTLQTKTRLSVKSLQMFSGLSHWLSVFGLSLACVLGLYCCHSDVDLLNPCKSSLLYVQVFGSASRSCISVQSLQQSVSTGLWPQCLLVCSEVDLTFSLYINTHTHMHTQGEVLSAALLPNLMHLHTHLTQDNTI